MIKFNKERLVVDRDEVYILRCLELALKGLGKTRQNPMVGAVIVNNDRIIGEGYHACYGGPHAEVNAINSLKDKSLLSGSTLYVNLEPCSHYGKTPPCSLLIRDLKIPKVIIGSRDPNPEVCGRGIHILKDCNVKVITGVKEKECRFINRRFFTFHERRRPYVILKWAQSVDGFIDIRRNIDDVGHTNWISGKTARLLVHKWRSEEIAIMVGTNTALTDNPELDVRYWPGQNPVRVVPDKNGRLFDNLKIFDGKNKTLILIPSYKQDRVNIEYVTLGEHSFTIKGFLEELFKRDILSILVEGGASLLNSFIQSGFWDEARVFTGNVRLHDGIKAPQLDARTIEQFSMRGDMLEVYVNF